VFEKSGSVGIEKISNPFVKVVSCVSIGIDSLALSGVGGL
jgi:hypothetical protein